MANSQMQKRLFSLLTFMAVLADVCTLMTDDFIKRLLFLSIMR